MALRMCSRRRLIAQRTIVEPYLRRDTARNPNRDNRIRDRNEIPLARIRRAVSRTRAPSVVSNEKELAGKSFFAITQHRRKETIGTSAPVPLRSAGNAICSLAPRRNKAIFPRPTLAAVPPLPRPPQRNVINVSFCGLTRPGPRARDRRENRLIES